MEWSLRLDNYSVLIDDLGVSAVVKSSQTYIKYYGLACDVGTTTSRKL